MRIKNIFIKLSLFALSVIFLISLCGLSVYSDMLFERSDSSKLISKDSSNVIIDKSKGSKDETSNKKDSCCEKNMEKVNVDVKVEQMQKLPKLPNISMFDQDGNAVHISNLLKGKITVINFIYTSCTSVCQVLTSNFRQLEKALDSIDGNKEVQLISISIDPDTDTPARLKQYADKQRLDLSRWTLLVSGLNSVEKFSRALGFSNIDKTTHAPGVVIWDDIDKSWQRFVGLTPPHILAKEISKLPAIKS